MKNFSIFFNFVKSNFKIFIVILIISVIYIHFITVNILDTKNDFKTLTSNEIKISKELCILYENINNMREYLPVFLATEGLSYEYKKEFLKKQNAIYTKSINNIDKLSREDVIKLSVALTDMYKMWDRICFELRNEYNFNKINVYCNKTLTNLYERIIYYICELNNQNEKYIYSQNESVEKKIDNIISISVLFSIIVVCIFIYMYFSEKRKYRNIKYKDKIFDVMSKNIVDGFIVLEDIHCFEFISANIESIIGLSREQILKNNNLFYDLFSKEDFEWIQNIINGIDKSKFSSREIMINNVRNKYLISIYVVEVDCKRLCILFISDNTESIMYNESLLNTLENTRDKNELKSKFIYNVSYKMSSYINDIIKTINTANEKINNKDAQNYLKKAIQSSSHLLLLVNNVLDFSKIEDGKFSIVKNMFTLPSCLESVVELIQQKANESKLSFTVRMGESLPEELLGDALQLKQILFNLLSNAVKFTPEGGSIALDVKQYESSDAKLWLRFVVSDTGKGMSEEFLQRLYWPFEEEDSSGKGYSGLSMSITKNLVHLCDGKISVESSVGKGTVFTVDLPFMFPEKS